MSQAVTKFCTEMFKEGETHFCLKFIACKYIIH